jgi:PPOX class probable FMN-dependent enzyme
MPTKDEPSYRYLRSKEELREILGTVNPRAANKARTELHRYHRDWIAASPFVLVSTSGETGQCDVSPKGDPAGATHIIDDRTLAIAERPGNRRADGFHNILDNGHVGLLYLVPGRGDTLRVNGRARLLRDAPFFDEMIIKGHRPRLVILVEIESIFFHCSKAFLRSQLWVPESWHPDSLPPRSTIAHSMERSDQTLEEVEAHYGATYGKGLY